MSSKLAMLQMNSVADVEENLREAEHLLAEAANNGARMAVLPENFATLGCKPLESMAETAQIRIYPWLLAQARKHALWIVAGSVPWPSGIDSRAYARCFIIDDEGVERARYDKIHLFDADVEDAHGAYRESQHYLAGSRLEILDTPLGRMAALICYDLRFPELFRILANAGVRLFCLPAAFTATTGEAHWESLLRARAIENQAYVVAVGQCGSQGPRACWGHSMAIGPWGDVQSCAGNEPGVFYADIQAASVDKARTAMPCLNHQRLATAFDESQGITYQSLGAQLSDYAIELYINGQVVPQKD